MNYSSYPFTLDIHGGVSQISFPVSLHDTARTLLISLTDGGKPYTIADGCRAVISAVKADGTHLLNDCITVGNKIIRYDFTPQTAAAVGKVDCEVRLYGEDGKLVTSPRFTIVVYEGLIDERIVSEDEKTTIDNMILAEQERVAAELAREEAEAVRNETMLRAEAAADRVAENINGDDVFIRYSAYPDGRDYTDTWQRGLNYIGVAAGLEEPADASGYQWSLFAPNIYVGSGEMPDYADVQIDPDSEDVDYVVVQEMGDSEVSVMSQKATTEAINKSGGVGGGVCANALKGSVTGSAVRIDDASPIEHNMAVRVRPYNFFENDTGKIEKVTYASSSGTTADRWGYAIHLPAGIYTIHAEPKNEDVWGSSGRYIYSIVNKADGSYVSGVYNVSNKVANGQIVAIDRCYEIRCTINEGDVLYVYNGVGATVAAPAVELFSLFDVQIEQGTTATEYVPYVDVSAVTVQKYGKNLLKYPYRFGSQTINGVTFAVNDDGTVLVNGTATDEAAFELYAPANITQLIANTEADLFLSGCPEGGSEKTFYIFDGWIGSKDTGKGVVLTKGGNRTKQIKIIVENGVTMNNALFKPQIEVGTIKSEYAPYIEPTEHAVNADGTVEGVTSLSPTTTLMTDTEGAVIDVEYNRDLNKAFAELWSVVDALVGG